MAGKDISHLPDSIIHNVVEASMSILELSSSFQVRPSQTSITILENDFATGLPQHQGRYIIYSSNQSKAFNDWWNFTSYGQHVASGHAQDPYWASTTHNAEG